MEIKLLSTGMAAVALACQPSGFDRYGKPTHLVKRHLGIALSNQDGNLVSVWEYAQNAGRSPLGSTCVELGLLLNEEVTNHVGNGGLGVKHHLQLMLTNSGGAQTFPVRSFTSCRARKTAHSQPNFRKGPDTLALRSSTSPVSLTESYLDPKTESTSPRYPQESRTRSHVPTGSNVLQALSTGRGRHY